LTWKNPFTGRAYFYHPTLSIKLWKSNSKEYPYDDDMGTGGSTCYICKQDQTRLDLSMHRWINKKIPKVKHKNLYIKGKRRTYNSRRRGACFRKKNFFRTKQNIREIVFGNFNKIKYETEYKMRDEGKAKIYWCHCRSNSCFLNREEKKQYCHSIRWKLKNCSIVWEWEYKYQ
jgi:hypothetical protein